jgi:hypothetical protein
MKNQPTVLTELTVGFGNNLFQFVYGKLLAEKIDAKLAVLPPYGDYFGLECLDLILDSVDSHEVIALYNSRALLTFEKYSKTLDSLGFDTLNIVSDLPEWKNYSGDELLNLDYHTHLSHGAKKMKDKAASYVNELVNKLSEKYEIKFHHKGLIKDFNFIRGFDKIMLGYSTFSWWAATLSDASWVGVFEPWRPWKENNKNLGKTNYPGWFGWK